MTSIVVLSQVRLTWRWALYLGVRRRCWGTRCCCLRCGVLSVTFALLPLGLPLGWIAVQAIIGSLAGPCSVGPFSEVTLGPFFVMDDADAAIIRVRRIGLSRLPLLGALSSWGALSLGTSPFTATFRPFTPWTFGVASPIGGVSL